MTCECQSLLIKLHELHLKNRNERYCDYIDFTIREAEINKIISKAKADLAFETLGYTETVIDYKKPKKKGWFSI